MISSQLKGTRLIVGINSSLAFGTASVPEYDGTSIALNQDIIVVSINYRTNVFGFPGAPDLPLTGNNLGFMDQELALEWVQSNIANFGGDPEQSESDNILIERHLVSLTSLTKSQSWYVSFHCPIDLDHRLLHVGPICWGCLCLWNDHPAPRRPSFQGCNNLFGRCPGYYHKFRCNVHFLRRFLHRSWLWGRPRSIETCVFERSFGRRYQGIY